MDKKKRRAWERKCGKWWGNRPMLTFAAIIEFMTTTPEGKQLVRELHKEVGDE